MISIGRLVIDDGYDFIWKHSDHQAVLLSPKGARHNLWNDMYTPMLAVQTFQDTRESKDDLLLSAPDILPSTAPVELVSQDTAEDEDSRAMSTRHLDSASNTKFLEILSGHGGLSKALQSLGHIIHSYDKNNDPKHDILNKKCARRITRVIEKINCIEIWFGMPCGTFTPARRYDCKGLKLL